MSSAERDLAADFRVFAETILDRLEPMIRRMDSGGMDAPQWQGCSWCPVCAFAAFVRGERHDLLTLAGTEIDQILAVLRDVLGEHANGPHQANPVPSEQGSTSEVPTEDAAVTDKVTDPGPGGVDPTHRSGQSRRKRAYVPITVTVKK